MKVGPRLRILSIVASSDHVFSISSHNGYDGHMLFDFRSNENELERIMVNGHLLLLIENTF